MLTPFCRDTAIAKSTVREQHRALTWMSQPFNYEVDKEDLSSMHFKKRYRVFTALKVHYKL
jgi:hypothetical protein